MWFFGNSEPATVCCQRFSSGFMSMCLCLLGCLSLRQCRRLYLEHCTYNRRERLEAVPETIKIFRGETLKPVSPLKTARLKRWCSHLLICFFTINISEIWLKYNVNSPIHSSRYFMVNWPRPIDGGCLACEIGSSDYHEVEYALNYQPTG